MKIFFRHYEIFGGFPAGFRPTPMAGKIRDIRAVEPIWCACGALAKGTVKQRLQDAKGLFSCVCPGKCPVKLTTDAHAGRSD
ncbi:MAG: hypothetical protein LBH90_04600 [Tannerella sp.]|jgi:hypothetical protein|nr:hypothetical protein [Tannerella sp.]